MLEFTGKQTLLSVSINLSIKDISYKWNHTIGLLGYCLLLCMKFLKCTHDKVCITTSFLLLMNNIQLYEYTTFTYSFIS